MRVLAFSCRGGFCDSRKVGDEVNGKSQVWRIRGGKDNYFIRFSDGVALMICGGGSANMEMVTCLIIFYR